MFHTEKSTKYARRVQMPRGREDGYRWAPRRAMLAILPTCATLHTLRVH